MDFIGLKINCSADMQEIVLAELSLFEFVAFEELEDGIYAACEEKDWDENEIKEVLEKYNLCFSFQKVEKINWNEEWEKNYDPVIIDDQIIVRASFHTPRPAFPHEIIVTPNMTFGTGHHATTYQVLKYQFGMDHEGKRVLDMGCGTGALAIMAAQKGATDILAVDIDEWCVENTTENIALNNFPEIRVKQGSVDILEQEAPFEIILANINKNILLDQIEMYSTKLEKAGMLVLSGFYEHDIDDLLLHSDQFQLQYVDRSTRNKWAMLALRKI
jgi:ribosomal protein L11 methyltransferase